MEMQRGGRHDAAIPAGAARQRRPLRRRRTQKGNNEWKKEKVNQKGERAKIPGKAVAIDNFRSKVQIQNYARRATMAATAKLQDVLGFIFLP